MKIRWLIILVIIILSSLFFTSLGLTKADIPLWVQVNTSGFGDPANGAVTNLELFQGQLYASTANWQEGAQVWRSQDGIHWQKMIDKGFGRGIPNAVIIDLEPFNGWLYAGTGWGTGDPAQVWRTARGRNWELVVADGFGDAGNGAVDGFISYNGMFYAGTTNGNGAQIWRSSSGDPGTWTRAGGDLILKDGGQVTSFAIFKDHLYVAVEPGSGGWQDGQIGVWRTVDGSKWELVIEPGFGDPENKSAGGFFVYKDYLYLGARNDVEGAELWRTYDGLAWDLVADKGLGNPNNIRVDGMFALNRMLYAYCWNSVDGMVVLRSADGVSWSQASLYGFDNQPANSTPLWSNGTVSFRGKIHIATWNSLEGGEIWKMVSR